MEHWPLHDNWKSHLQRVQNEMTGNFNPWKCPKYWQKNIWQGYLGWQSICLVIKTLTRATGLHKVMARPHGNSLLITSPQYCPTSSASCWWVSCLSNSFPEFLSLYRSPTYPLLPSYWPFSSLLRRCVRQMRQNRDTSSQCTKKLSHNKHTLWYANSHNTQR